MRYIWIGSRICRIVFMRARFTTSIHFCLQCACFVILLYSRLDDPRFRHCEQTPNEESSVRSTAYAVLENKFDTPFQSPWRDSKYDAIDQSGRSFCTRLILRQALVDDRFRNIKWLYSRIYGNYSEIINSFIYSISNPRKLV
jgi:hypothetical protein